jgi:y4mF family transcriptional regulator
MSKAIRNKFGKQIRNMRHSLGWSQEDLADKSGVHRTYIGAIERGEQNVSIDNIIKLAKALGVSLEQLFKGL